MSVREDPAKRAGDPAEEPEEANEDPDVTSPESFPASDPPQSEGSIA